MRGFIGARDFGSSSGVGTSTGRGVAQGKGKGGGGGTPPPASETLETWSLTRKGNGIALSNGNLTATENDIEDWAQTDLVRSSGRRYFEILVDVQASTFLYFGLVASTLGFEEVSLPGGPTVMWKQSGVWSVGGGSNPATFAATNVLGFAVDFTARTMTGAVNNVYQGVTAQWAAGSMFRIGMVNTFGTLGNAGTLRTNLAAFTYAPPPGYVSWATDN